jgi:sugar lactone lactonase YvrE
MQDGSADNNIYGGDWWMANQTMERALVFSGYEVNHAWGDGAHNGKHPTAIFPDAMRYLWKDWPQPVKNGPSKNQFLQDLLIPGEGWQLVSEGYKFTEGPACNSKGEVFFTDGPNNKTHKIALDGTVSVAIEDRRGNGQHFGPDGRLYAVGGPDDKVMAYGADMKGTAIAEQIRGNDLVIAHNGNIYITAPAPSTSTDPSSVWLVKPDGSKQVVDSGIRFPNGVTLSPDQSLLYVADYRSHWVYSFQVEPDGTLKFKQKYYHLHEPDSADDAGPDGIRCDHDGRLYVATRMGIQICDQAGRVNCIIPTPNGRVSNLCFGGEKFDSLFATCGDKVFKRKLKVQGAPSWQEPSKPAAPRL